MHTVTNKRDLSNEDLERVLDTIEIPVCPAIVVEVLAEAQKDDPDMKKLAASIASDVGMAATAIKLANSPLFRVGSAISSVPKALATLGTRNIVSIIVAVALRASMSGLPVALVEKFWDRASAVAVAAGLIARRLYNIPPDVAYTYALFHDAAIPLMMRRFDNYAQLIESARQRGQFLIDAESELFPCTHPVIGSLLVRNWGLPALLGQAIRFHHEPDLYELPEQTLPGTALDLIAVTQVAEHLATEMSGEDDLEVGEAHFSKALAHLDIVESELEDLLETLESTIRTVCA